MNFEALANQIDAIQHTLQAQAAHAVNLALTARNWLIGYYIVEFEQNGEDRAAYGEKLLKKLESRLHTKGLTERRFREFRRLYQVYPQLQSSVIQYLDSNAEIRRLATAEFKEPIRRLATAKSSDVINPISTVHYNNVEPWMIPADRHSMKWRQSEVAGLSRNWSVRYIPCIMSAADCRRTKKRCRHWCSSKQLSYSQKM